MSEHTPLTEAEIRRIKARLLDWLVDDDDTYEEARPMRELAHKMAHNLVPVIETFLAARTSTATADTGSWAACTGASDCPERWHVHGCFADRGQCDDPTDHHAATADTGLRERVEAARDEGVDAAFRGAITRQNAEDVKRGNPYRVTPASTEAEHDCSRCPDCIHDGNKCCGCYDSACCQDDEPSEGCDCTELCAMGPTCPGGMLAGLDGSGCWRTEDRTHGGNHAPLSEGVLLDPGFCKGCDDLRGASTEDRADNEGRCPTCGPTTTEQHPRRDGVTRCTNCKEWLEAGS